MYILTSHIFIIYDMLRVYRKSSLLCEVFIWEWISLFQALTLLLIDSQPSYILYESIIKETCITVQLDLLYL